MEEVGRHEIERRDVDYCATGAAFDPGFLNVLPRDEEEEQGGPLLPVFCVDRGARFSMFFYSKP